GLDFLPGLGDRLGLGDIAGIGLEAAVRLAGSLLHFRLGRRQRLGLARQNRHRAARCGEFLGHREAQTGARTGDHGHAAIHAYVHSSLLRKRLSAAERGEREGPIAKRWEGEVGARFITPSATVKTTTSPSHCYATGPFLSPLRGGEETTP